MTRVLFVVGGFGLGNSTRCDALIQKLTAKGTLVDVATSANGLWYFTGSTQVRNLIPLSPLAYAERAGQISLIRTALRLPLLAWNLVSNAITIFRAQKTSRYNYIVVDSEYSSFLIKKFLSVPLITVNNVFFTLSKTHPKRTNGFSAASLMVEHFDLFIQKTFSDFCISPTFLDETKANSTGTLFCPPIVRSSFSRCEPTHSFSRALLVMSGSRLGVSESTIERLAECEEIQQIDVVGLEGHSSDKVRYFKKQKDISSLIAKSDFIVSNGGFSTISEALVSRRPILVIPIPNHAEQIRNAELVETLGLGVMATSDMSADLERLTQLRSFGEEKNFLSNGAEPAANALMALGMQC